MDKLSRIDRPATCRQVLRRDTHTDRVDTSRRLVVRCWGGWLASSTLAEDLLAQQENIKSLTPMPATVDSYQFHTPVFCCPCGLSIWACVHGRRDGWLQLLFAGLYYPSDAQTRGACCSLLGLLTTVYACTCSMRGLVTFCQQRN